jgi:putative restriction endonuclease
VNILERALVEKTGREHGWENVLESITARVVLASARHRGRANIHAGAAGEGWQIEFPDHQLARGLPELAHDVGWFAVPNIDRLSALLSRAAELALSLPDQAAQTFREQVLRDLADIATQGTEVERLVRQRVGQDVFRQALLDYWGGACALTGLDLPEILRASHAKPWASCENDDERLDAFNGLLLCSATTMGWARHLHRAVAREGSSAA